jgi:peptidoglycan/xylan/chitin deacetylase (PgdA/CDA1 family)
MNAPATLRRAAIYLSVESRLDAASRWLDARAAGRRVHALNFHATPTASAAGLRCQLAWALERFRALDLDALGDLWRHPQPQARPGLLLTFDDGLASNYHVAAPLLESIGARGVFFVCPGFAGLEGARAREFYLERLARRRDEPLDKETWTPMTPRQIADLAARGHAIGNHTYTHAPLGSIPPARLAHEIVRSRETLEAWTGRPVRAFAWTYSWDQITPPAWNLARAQHEFCFAPCAGVTDAACDRPDLIWRSHAEAAYPPYEYRFIYSRLPALVTRVRRWRLASRLRNANGDAPHH